MKTVDHSHEQALIMYDNVHIHVIMNIIVTPTVLSIAEKINQNIIKRLNQYITKTANQNII